MKFSKAFRALTIGGIGLAAVLTLGVLPASGAPAGVSGAEVDAAKQAAAGPDTTTKLAHFFVQLDQRGSAGKLSQAQIDAASVAKAPKVDGEPLQVFSLNPAFVAGKADVPVAEFAYLSMRARSAAGQEATIWLTPEPNGWQATNLTTGTEEVTYPAQAGGDLVFTEPQINAWYRVRGDQVVPLNDPARARVGQGTTLAGYQSIVHQQYGDKLPGSDYVNQGRLGGYQPRDLAPADSASGQSVSPLLAGVAGLAVVLAAAGWIVRRRVVIGTRR
ncbi:hypothetical protein [Amycolatopsis anabasis]|uniref:hypothetical protein n=1 Tax=Amycolatopsis anabasis TaxID=1840409 RepID=UPI00131DFD7B|nr:hypothetical protein [Amycolatopsis anabasis]